MKKTQNTKQLEILQFIYETVKKQGYPPTVREICMAVDLASTSTVHGHLERLERKGLIARNPAKPRAMEVTSNGEKLLGIKANTIPILGVVTAGQPILAVEEANDFFPLPPELTYTDGDLFMLTIRGESMIKAGILDGDQVIVRQQNQADNGDIVIAMTDDNEATCKRFFKEAHTIRLQPENDSMAPIILDNVSILGKVVGLFRPHVF